MKPAKDIRGKPLVGVGFRRDLADSLIESTHKYPQFLEFAPENWMGIGGFWRRKLKEANERYPFVTHGLSLSIGGPDELDLDFLARLKAFLKEYSVSIYSEHLSYAKCDNAHLHDLLPIPFREDAIDHVVERIKKVQDYLGMQLTLENVSYYTPVAPEMDEATFIREVINRSGCGMLLDVNNVYVNAFNHKYDAKEFISQLPLDKVIYIHMAGHEQRSNDLIIDTHGAPIIDPVYELFEYTVAKLQPVPILLERDFNIPAYTEVENELDKLGTLTKKHWGE